jgi:hypothetical protein
MAKGKKKQFEVIDIGLPACPFCKEDPEFGLNLKNGFHELRHWPSKGVICPARTEQHMGATLEEATAFAHKFWRL